MLRLYRVPFSTNVERVALALGHKELEAEWVDIDPSDRSEVERVSGQPLVPVLVENGHVVIDSTEIIRYLEEQVPVPPLWPDDPARRAELDIFSTGSIASGNAHRTRSRPSAGSLSPTRRELTSSGAS